MYFSHYCQAQRPLKRLPAEVPAQVGSRPALDIYALSSGRHRKAETVVL